MPSLETKRDLINWLEENIIKFLMISGEQDEIIKIETKTHKVEFKGCSKSFNIEFTEK